MLRGAEPGREPSRTSCTSEKAPVVLPMLEPMRSPREALAVLVAAAEDGRLDEICDRFGLDLVSVFGSVLDDRVAEPSDLDVAVRFGPAVETDHVGVISALTELVGCERLDVLVLNRAGVVARSRALGPGSRGLFERERGAYALAQMAAVTEEMETAPMRRRDLELLAAR